MYKVPTFYCWSLEGIPRTHVLLPPLGPVLVPGWQAGHCSKTRDLNFPPNVHGRNDQSYTLWTISKTHTHIHTCIYIYNYSTNMYKTGIYMDMC